jgi:hypothetical protein
VEGEQARTSRPLDNTPMLHLPALHLKLLPQPQLHLQPPTPSKQFLPRSFSSWKVNSLTFFWEIPRIFKIRLDFKEEIFIQMLCTKKTKIKRKYKKNF